MVHLVGVDLTERNMGDGSYKYLPSPTSHAYGEYSQDFVLN
jgi:hypothetical protein